MGAFALALAGFVLIHVGVAATGARAEAVRRIGEGPYRALFSLVSAALLVWLFVALGAMRRDPFDPLNEAFWSPPGWAHWPAVALALLGISIAVAGVLTPGPTFAGFERRTLASAEPARGVLRITRHPFLWGVALWGAGHLLANGERFAVMLFGALTFMVIYGARSIDRKGSARDPKRLAAFEAVTSNVPFVAIAQGRNRFALGEMWPRLLAGVAVAVLIALTHEKSVRRAGSNLALSGGCNTARMIAVFDRAHFDHMTGSDRALQLEVIGLFRGQLEGWDAGVGGGDWRTVVHTIKGSARGIGLHALAAACERAEAGDAPEPGMTDVRAAMREAIAALDVFSADAG